MRLDDRERFRIITHPDISLPPQPILREAVQLDGDWLYVREDEPEPVDLSDELVLRDLCDLQLNDGEAVTDFLNEHGLLPPTFDLLLPGQRSRRRRNAPPQAYGNVMDAIAYLTVARAMANHWVASMTDQSVAKVWSAVSPDVTTKREAWMFLIESLNFGLVPYHPRIEATFPGIRGHPYVVGGPRVHLFNGLSLQVFNLMVEAIPPLQCLNETCGRWFVRQHGRAEQGQYRVEGVKYCSASCARAQAQREYKRRKRQERPQGER